MYVVKDPFNNILVILWQLVLLVEETGRSEENHRQTLLYTKLCGVLLARSGIRTHNISGDRH